MNRIFLLFFTIFALVGCTLEVDPNGDEMAGRYPRVHFPDDRPAVPTITPREGPWSGDSSLGQEQPFSANIRNTLSVLKRTTDGAPEVWTVSLQLTNTLKAYDGFGVTAQILFGSGGLTETVEMDWLNGSQISWPANSIEVIALFDNVDVTTEGPGLRVGATIAKGVRASVAPPRLTMAESIEVADAAFSAPLEVPAFASNIVVVPVAANSTDFAAFYGANTALEAFGGNSGGNFISSISGVQMAQGMALPVAGSTRFVRWRNSSGRSLTVTIFAELYG